MYSFVTNDAPPPARPPRRASHGPHALAALGTLFVLFGLALNGHTLAYLFSTDAAITGDHTLVWIRGVQMLTVALGLAIVAFRVPLAMRSAALIRRWPRVAAGTLGFTAVVALTLSVELAFHARNTITARNRPPVVVTYSVPLWQPDIVCHSRKTIGDQLIYEATYRRDAAGARVSPDSPTAFTGRDMVFFGGSFTFGQGAEDFQTLPNQLARHMPRWRMTNFGYPGHGPAHMLERLNDPGTLEPFAGSKLVVVDVFISDHVRRTIGSMRVATTWGSSFPNLITAPDGSVEVNGTMTTGRPVRSMLYRYLAQEPILNYFGVDLPIRIRDADLELIARIHRQCRDQVARANPTAEFYVVLFPDRPNAEFTAARLIPFLEAAGIRYLDYSHRLLGRNGMWIPGDTHPTPAAYALVAEWIAQDLGAAKPGAVRLAQVPGGG